jgi:hypothetical protein
MLAFVAALAVAVAVPAPPVLGAAFEGVKTKKKKKKSTGTTTAKDKEKDQPEETSEGLDLTAPDSSGPPPSSIESPPADSPTVTEAPPPAAPVGKWSIVTPRTVGPGNNLIEAGVGWPGLAAGYWRGILDPLDVGVHIEVNWSLEGVITNPWFGFTVQAQVKYRILEKDKLSVGASFKPGVIAYFPPARPVHAGAVFPLSVNAGYALMEKLNLGAFLEVPFWFLAGYATVIPILLGAGVEYSISEALNVWVAVKGGPAIWLGSPIYGYLDAKAGIGFHL